MARPPVIGIMGPGIGARPGDLDNAYRLARLIARAGWTLLTGGRNEGVMAAAHKGCAEEGGFSIGILPGKTAADAAPGMTVPIVTGLGSARNNVNVLTSNVIVACGAGLGTVSEIALALKAEKPVVLLACGPETHALFNKLAPHWAQPVDTPEQAFEAVRYKLAGMG
ncbi:MAG: LOG family protein [Nitrospirae bacterium]|nr:LOG family protein [Nitrospirota bacterium]